MSGLAWQLGSGFGKEHFMLSSELLSERYIVCKGVLVGIKVANECLQRYRCGCLAAAQMVSLRRRTKPP
jgi:hypothetical protein